MITKFTSQEELLNHIRGKIASDDAWAKKALKVIYANQTSSEKQSEETIEYNGVGFSGKDAKFFSSLAKQLLYKESIGKSLTESQMVFVRRVMPRYAGQLMRQSIDSGKIRKENGVYVW